MADIDDLTDFQEEFLDERRVQGKTDGSAEQEKPLQMREMIKNLQDAVSSLQNEFSGLHQQQTTLSVELDGLENHVQQRFREIDMRMDQLSDVIIRDQANKSVSLHAKAPVAQIGSSEQELIDFLNPHVRIQQEAAKILDSEHAAMMIPEQRVKVKLSELQSVADTLRDKGVSVNQIFMPDSNKHTP